MQGQKRISENEILTYEMHRKGAFARARLHEDGKMTVMEGSTIANDVARSMNLDYLNLRNRLIELAIIVMKDYRWTFARNYEFANPSEAICVIAGNSRSGSEWKCPDGKTLREHGLLRSLHEV